SSRRASFSAAALVLAMPSGVGAEQSFRTAEEAVDALVSAVRTSDRKDILNVLGLGSADISSSGDEAIDAAAANISSQPMMRSIASPWTMATRQSWWSGKRTFRS